MKLGAQFALNIEHL